MENQVKSGLEEQCSQLAKVIIGEIEGTLKSSIQEVVESTSICFYTSSNEQSGILLMTDVAGIDGYMTFRSLEELTDSYLARYDDEIALNANRILRFSDTLQSIAERLKAAVAEAQNE